MTKIKLAYLISDIDRAIAFEWVVEQLDHSKFDLVFILFNSSKSYFKNYLEKKNIPFHLIEAGSKKSFPSAMVHLLKIYRQEKPQIIHCHLFTASLLGLTAARLCGIKQRIHTRHHASQHHIYHPAAIKYDRWINACSTKIIAITENVKQILMDKEGVPEEKIQLIHHGFDLDFFAKVDEKRIADIKEKYNSNKQHPLVGVVSRYTLWKGVQYIIPAFEKLLKDYPNALLVLANTNGNDSAVIKKMLQKIPAKNVLEIDFEYDNAALYYLFDVFVHVPINHHAEAFGQTYVEALAAGIPAVFTLSGIAHDFIEHKRNAVVVNYENEKEITDALKLILEKPSLRQEIIKNGREDVYRLFSLKQMMDALEACYKTA